ncbi:PNK3P-domain-containing protein [Lentinus brumalis]|uniref:PNK3P-domain-containing protein n=1 Tax=Lentinus brumalis TaxID=2498619 RepID=A0A371CYW1_9APHY|nr:PNK3P-domain-containing protein [Polyporus brumalis]
MSKAQMFSIFSKPGEASSQSSSSFRWITPALGPKRSCLHGVNGAPESSPKIAAFDLDGCIIQSSFPKKGAPPKFEWWRKDVPKKLKEVHEQGYAVVIISNQALRTSALISDWKKKIPLIANALSDVPFHIFAATEKDGYRKPIPGMWYELERIFAQDHVQIDVAASFFVGDAAGRPNDHSSTDRKLALNIGIPFYTPEVYFLKLPAAKYILPGFHVSSLPTQEERIVPAEPPILPAASSPELVIFVGYPALGKSSFFQTHFVPAGYTHVNQDMLKTRDKCIKAAAEALQAGQSVVVDNTNRDVQTRKFYIDLAKKQDVPIRCFYFAGSLELAWHNNLYRAFNLPVSLATSQPKRELLPYNAFTSFRANFQEPTVDEGFYEVRKVNWQFEGDEDARKRWSMWLQIDGK